MRHQLVFALLLTLAACSSAAGQEWARKMFKTTRHDFGTVARGSKAEFSFELENLYEEDVHIAGVRSTCGCTAPNVTKEALKTWEKGAIVAALDTVGFTGPKNATVIVTIDRPFYAEVRLEVVVNIRSDVVFTPGIVQFGAVDSGEGAQATVRVAHAGRGDWQITDVRSANSSFEVALREARRTPATVDYDMVVRVKPGAPPGYFHDELTIVTNDSPSQSISLAVQGRVLSSLVVSPASLILGVVTPGQQVTKQIVVKGKKPFRITRMSCESGCFAFAPSDEEKTVHLVPVTFTAPSEAGKLSEQIQVETEAGAASMTAVATVAEG